MPGDRFIELATAEDRRVLDILFRHASEAVSVQDRSGRLLSTPMTRRHKSSASARAPSSSPPHLRSLVEPVLR